MHFAENKPLAPFTTLGVGGPARWFARAENEADVADAAKWARENNVPLFVLGGGSNLVVADDGFNGLVLQLALRGVTSEERGEDVLVCAAAGESWSELVDKAVDSDWAGIECLAGIPGTVGGTPVQNVGAYGQEVADVIVRVRAYDLLAREFVEMESAQCGFAYRRSRFNAEDSGRFVVTRVDYRLKKHSAPTLRYAELQKAFAGEMEPTLREVSEAVKKIRQSKGMLLVEGDADCHSAGSFFKNPVLTQAEIHEIALAAGKEPPRFPAGDDTERVKIPAAWLIEQAGFKKGYQKGPVGISSKHTLALVNRGGATTRDLMDLAEEIGRAVEMRFGVRLAMEPVRLGFGE